MKMNISANTGSELEKHAELEKHVSEPFFSSNKTTGSELKKPASSVISITPNSDENETKISSNNLCPRFLAYFGLMFLAFTAFTAFLTLIPKSNEEDSELICKILKAKFDNDTSSEMEYVSKICKNQAWNQIFLFDRINYLQIILQIISIVCSGMIFSIGGFGFAISNFTMNLFVTILYIIGFFDLTILIMSILFQFFISCFVMVTNILSSDDFKITPMPKNKPVTKNPHKTKPRNDIGKII